MLLFDGVFLLREELFDRWDLRIFVSATFEKTLDRCRIRDQRRLISADEVEQRYRSRYIPSQQFYFETVRPAEHANIIVYNDDPLAAAMELPNTLIAATAALMSRIPRGGGATRPVVPGGGGQACLT